MLKCEDPTTNPADIKNEFRDSDEGSQHTGQFQADFEHGQWFVTCVSCGAQWSVNDAEGREGDYYQFDEITEGDGFCFEGDRA